MRTITRTLLSPSIISCVALVSPLAHGDTITLKTAARLGDDRATVTLADIAVLEGSEALRLADVQIATIKPGAGAKPVEFSVIDVRRALDAAAANWAKINLNGRSVIVRPARSGDSLPPQAMSSAIIDDRPDDGAVEAINHPAVADALTLDALVTEATVRGSIASLIIANLRVDPRDVRVRIDGGDAELLATSLSTSRFEIQPMGSPAGDRLVFAIRSWNGAAVESKGQITLVAERRVQVTRAARDLARGAGVVDSDIAAAAEWLAPSEATQAAPLASIVGRSLSRQIKAGEMLRMRDIEREALVKRGDIVSIRCLVGGVAISLQAEARADGSLGDTIEFRKNGERESFRATIAGRGEAVVDLTKK